MTIGQTSRGIPKAIFPFAISAACFLCATPRLVSMLTSPYDDPYSDDLAYSIMARKIGYVAWPDESPAILQHPPSPLLVVFVTLAPVALALGASVKVGYPRWYIPVFVVAAYFAGSLFFTPQSFPHYQSAQPSTIFLHNIGVSAVGSAATAAILFLHRLARADNRPPMTWLLLSYSWTTIAFHFLASFFYIFRLLVIVE
jgi:hypothetical protein